MNKLKISIITVSYNQGKYIEDNILSVFNQHYENCEHIIIDACSTDGTIGILKKYPHLIWTSEPDKGQSDGLNKGFRKATGDIIAWINSDDMLYPDALKKINTFFEENPDKYVLTGNQVIIDDNGNELRTISAKKFTYNHLLNERSSVMQNSTFFRRGVLLDIGYLDESFHYTMDHELFVRIASKYENFTINENLAYFRIWAGSKTYTSQINFFKETIRMKRKHHAKIFSSGNIWLLWQFIKEPFKHIPGFRNFVRLIKGTEPIK